MSDLHTLRDQMRAFTAERSWHRYHDPKSLILAITGELGELAELFQWLPADQALAQVTDEPQRTAVSDEVADILLYLVRLADVLDIDLASAGLAKMEKNRAKHGVTP